MIVRRVDGGLEALAPAKLNLFLEVRGKRPDGYHELETLMVAVDLHDALRVAEGPSGRIDFRCDDPSLPTGPDNLVVRAAERLRSASGTDRGATIELRKAIPAGAGLGGGSSDAAATLAALDLLWDLRTPPDRLDALAGEIGSDVAFFLHAPAAVCRGRGELVEPIPAAGPLHFVLVCPPFGVATAEVYRRVQVPERPRPIGPVLEAFRLGDPTALGPSLFNRLEPAAVALAPALGRVGEALATLGPGLLGSGLSGSGSAWFGLCRDPDAARSAAETLRTLTQGRVWVVSCGP
jgi:4-diphosphocytidyl-2-C-methyl-D-erythritol kinase